MEEKLRILEDLNMIYIRQIALSLKDSDIQKKIDYEIRMREGACKLLAACSQRDQALEASKSLLTCNARIMAYMSELQRMKEAQVMQRVARRSSDAGPMDDRSPCKAKVAISDLRIPLMWKDTEYFKNKGELHRCAVFCLLQLGGEIFDTDMVMVDRTLTDICFDNTIVFNEASPGFELRVELYSCCSEEDYSAGSTPRKLASKLSTSLGRSSGKKMRGALEPGACSPTSNGGGAAILLPVPSVPGPKYHLLAHTTLNLSHVQDSFRTHDFTITGNEECSYWLPLYGGVCCRLAAQPHCMTQQMMSGCLRVKLGGEPQGWTNVYGVLKGTNLFCYHQKEDMEANVEPVLTIGINKETRIRASEKDPHSKAQNICITNQYGGEEVMHTLAADSREDTQHWMEAFWQQFYDMSQWRQCCDDLMKIELPSPRKPAIVTPKQGSLYHEMGDLFCLFFSVLFSLWFLYLSLHCCFPPSSFTLFLLIFHALLYFPGFMPSICNPNIHPMHSPTTVSLYGCYINPHFLALPTTLHLLAPHTFCWPPPPQWPLHPVRGFCCRITLSLLRSELCSPPITMTGEVTVMRSYLTSRSTFRRCYCPT
uniref:Rhotekin n=1 Tax=Cyprinus carpio TaxID=7962 RepID=A0A8C2BJA1_CYPCA